MHQLSHLSIAEIQAYYHTKEKSPTEVIGYFLDRLAEQDDKIHAVVRISKEQALAHAKELEKELQEHDFDTIVKNKPLFGIPYLMKDNILVEGLVVTSQSKILEDFVAPYSSDVFTKLYNAGAVLIGQTNMDEFAFGSSTEFSGFGNITHNPHDLTRVAGGTSGGSAAGVGHFEVPFAIGTDTGGSIRQPSSFCGVYGLRPTYGVLSRYGIMASTSSFDQPGPIARNVEDIQKVFEVLLGKSATDQTNLSTLPEPTPTKKLTIGIPQEFYGDGLDKKVRDSFDQVITKLSETYTIKEVSLAHSKSILAVYYILQTVEAAANLERFDGIRFGKDANPQSSNELFFTARGNLFGDEVKRRIMLGTYTSSAGYYDAYYNKACQVRELIRQEYLQLFEHTVDVLLMPASPFPAFKIGEHSQDPLSMYLADIMTVSQPISRLASLVAPIQSQDFDGVTLPIGAQIVGPELSENTLFAIAQTIQSYHLR